MMSTTTNDVLTAVGSTTTSPDPKEQAKLARKCRNAFKAATYMFCVTIQVAEKTSKSAGEASLPKRAKERRYVSQQAEWSNFTTKTKATLGV
jgi:hypothetical protein